MYALAEIPQGLPGLKSGVAATASRKATPAASFAVASDTPAR